MDFRTSNSFVCLGSLQRRQRHLRALMFALTLAGCDSPQEVGEMGMMDASFSGATGAVQPRQDATTTDVHDASAPPIRDGGAGGTAGSLGGNDAQVMVRDAATSADPIGPVGASDGGGEDAARASDGGTPTAVTCPTAALRPGEMMRTVQVGSTSRTFILHVPRGYTGEKPVPLVIDWHPIFGSGSAERTGSGYLQLSDQEGFVIAFPNGIDQAWNVGPCCTLSRTVDDVGFARAIVQDIQRQACIDPKRIYTTGFSMGGGMSHYLACSAADLFAAAAPASFDLLTDEEQSCKPTRPITVISFRGTADMVVPYAGGASNPPNGLPTIHFRGAVGTFEKWRTLNGCTGTPTVSNGCQTYKECKNGVETTLCTVQNGGHSYGDANLGWTTMKRFTLP